MAIYAINCTLKSPDKDYMGLMRTLRSFPDSCHVQKGFWIVRSPKDQDSMFQTLASELVPGDELFIMAYTNGGATWTGNQGESATKLQDMLYDPGHQRETGQPHGPAGIQQSAGQGRP